jgi:hypothetical protein
MTTDTKDQPNPLRKKCGQVKRVEFGFTKSLIFTTYVTFALKDEETYDYDWDYKKNQTIKTLRTPRYKKDDLLFLETTLNKSNGTTQYALYDLEGKPIHGFGRDRDITERHVYVDKKW